MNDTNLNTRVKANWLYITNLETVSEYLNLNDIIEASKVCKYYRRSLEEKIFKNVNLISQGEKLPATINNAFLRPEKLPILLNNLNKDLKDKLNLVKELYIGGAFISHLNTDFLKLFSNLATITVNSTFQPYNLDNLINILQESKKLKYIKLRSNFTPSTNWNYEQYYNFFKTLTSIELIDGNWVRSKISPFDCINTAFTNLKSLTISDNQILKNLSTGLKSLKSAEFLNSSHFDKVQICNFIQNNPQLNKLTISNNHLNLQALNSILSLKELNFLNIKGEFSIDSACSDLMQNLSVKSLTLSHGFNDELLELITSCRSLETLKLDRFTYYNSTKINWSKFNSNINTIQLNECTSILPCLVGLPILNYFKHIKFSNNNNNNN